ncbi:tryptophan synthase beta subunit-like PLP-dependent enzyme [Hortaea werneckii]|nr:tryptophan synthase beta subunit-like PLP-dependent enzyme [Hortaea werneckii]
MARDTKIQYQPKPWRKTPLVESANLSKAAGCRIFLKLDLLQPSGSFKSRGIGAFILSTLQRSSNPEKIHFFSSSGGNAGLAAVTASKALGRPCTVVVPNSTKPMMIAKLKAAGASEVVQYGASWKEADTYMRDHVMKSANGGTEAVSVHPFDADETRQGNSTVVEEIDDQLLELGEGDYGPDVLVASVGGGGLFSGIAQAIFEDPARAHWRTTVLATETKGADSLSQALAKKELVTLPGITSLATSLGATRVAERTFELAKKWEEAGRVKSAVFTDAEAAMGCWRLADDERLLVELACGVNLAVCYGGRLEKALGRPVRKDEKVVIEVCGGSNVSTEITEGWRREYGDLDADVNGAQQVADVPSAAEAPNGKA